MKSVAALQRDFQRYVLGGGETIAAEIIDGPRIDAKARLAIYAGAYGSRLQEVLAADYPALSALAGDDLFAEIAKTYLAAHPSRHPNAREFGRQLAGFLAAPPWVAHPVLAEMARFEWAMAEAFYASDDDALDRRALSGVPAQDWPQMRLRLRSSFRQVSLAWNVPDFRAAVDGEGDPVAPRLASGRGEWIAWRPALTVRFRQLEPDEAIAMLALRTGHDFAQLCEALAESSPPESVSRRMAELVSRWVGEGLLARC